MTITTMARAWAITRRDGLVLGFTDHDDELRFDGIDFRPDAGLSALAVMQGSGLSVDNTEAVGALSDGAIHERDILAGRWDGAELRQWEVDWSDPGKARLVFRGHLGEVSRSGGAFRAELRGLSEPMNQSHGRVFHPRCDALLGDGRCKLDLDRPGLRGTARIEWIKDGRIGLAGLEGFEDRWFERGECLILSGAAEGLSAQVKNDRALPGGRREVELWVEPGIPPAAGDQVRLTAGCDKAAATCLRKFANFPNFRGFPDLPQEDWLMAPDADRGRGHEAHDD
ncbi:DUF2163 domain-containing protein [Paracoccus aerodenitrificans]|uniref:DUF2163 domain-containing protein n=1 Tax=Paracoccus aerodenitrificans TaxID=3017781 RepID=UPI0022F08232|nr:DUF2163 domain-containing protein [Paracoccus aerodenitrificans]WBU65345.1 DUF2163 domain-containing protein [Paracoccus aerodenitrificans]